MSTLLSSLSTIQYSTPSLESHQLAVREGGREGERFSGDCFARVVDVNGICNFHKVGVTVS